MTNDKRTELLNFINDNKIPYHFDMDTEQIIINLKLSGEDAFNKYA